MIELAELASEKTLKLPEEIVAQAPEGEPLSLEEINEIVHEVRRQQQNVTEMVRQVGSTRGQ